MRRLTLLITLFAVFAAPATAGAATPLQIFDDCEDNGRLDGTYSERDLRKALRGIPQDLNEYSNCSELITTALARGRGSAGGGGVPQGLPEGNGVGSVPLGPTGKPLNPLIDAAPEERRDVSRATAGDDIRPSAGGVRPGEPDSDLPVPLLVALALIAAALLAAGAVQLKHLVVGRPA